MKTLTKSKIIDFINKKGRARPAELIDLLGISQVAVQKQLKKLIQEGSLEKHGKPPLVFYTLASKPTEEIKIQFSPKHEQYLENNYLYLTPDGLFLSGVKGFKTWLQKTDQIKQAQNLVEEYVLIREQSEKFRAADGLIDATSKLSTIFHNFALQKIYYADFYSLPKFGKTKMGLKLLHAKQAQDKNLIKELSVQCESLIHHIVAKHNINTIAWIPHSIPRKIPFLSEFKKNIHLPLNSIEIVKAYTGEIPVAQKSLSKIQERIENARKTIFIKSLVPSQNKILLIDDAVGSGATLNETALKIMQNDFVKTLIGFVVVGSYKGFEVIKEV